jgi:glucose/arabinose dehydrogenase
MLRSPTSLLVIAFAAAVACRDSGNAASGGCDKSIKLPEGFCASVFTDSAGLARHIAVRSNGDVIVGMLDQRRQPGGVMILRDTDKDGRADASERFGESGVHGVVLAGDSVLYVSTSSAVIRYRLTDSLAPRHRVDTIVAGLVERKIPSHSLAIDARGNLIVNIGAVSNGCQAKEQPGAPGRDPCPELAVSGGIWRFATNKTNQTILDGVRIATGLHNAVALTVSPHDTMVYAVSHGRDGLRDLWPNLYSDQENASAAAEEMIRIATVRADFGWPYCYYDYLKDHRVLAPEYGGNKVDVTHCDRQIQPLIAFPAHWSPMSLHFYTGKMFPAQYRSGAFIAFHGSAYRAPLLQEGYHVVFLEFKDGFATDYKVFADGFAGSTPGPETARHRPTGLAEGPDGALYVSDDRGGRIWRITYAATKGK